MLHPGRLKADSELNYSSADDEPVEKTEAEKAKKKKAASESSEPKSSKSSSEELILEEESLPADGQPVPRGHKSNIQTSYSFLLGKSVFDIFLWEYGPKS